MRGVWLVFAVLPWLPGCDDDEGDDTIAIEGEYTDNFMGQHAITAETWTQSGAMIATSVFHLLEHDNSGRYAIAHNDLGNPFAEGKYSRFDWVNVGSTLYVCQTAFEAESQADAKAVDAADDTDPATKGCGVSEANEGFPWSALTPR